jgi:hypothetical protein
VFDFNPQWQHSLHNQVKIYKGVKMYRSSTFDC